MKAKFSLFFLTSHVVGCPCLVNPLMVASLSDIPEVNFFSLAHLKKDLDGWVHHLHLQLNYWEATPFVSEFPDDCLKTKFCSPRAFRLHLFERDLCSFQKVFAQVEPKYCIAHSKRSLWKIWKQGLLGVLAL